MERERRILAASNVRTVEFDPDSYSHVSRIAALHKAYLLEEFERTDDYAPGLPLVAHANTLLIRCGDAIGGFIVIDPHRRALELIYLAPEHRGHGIAAALMTQLRVSCPGRMYAKLPFTPGGAALVERARLLPLQPSSESLRAADEQRREIHRVIRRDCQCRRGGNPAKPCGRCFRRALKRSTEYAIATYLTDQRTAATG